MLMSEYVKIALISFTSPKAKSFSAYKDKRLRIIIDTGSGDVKNVEAVRLHPLELGKILEQTLRSKQSGQKRARICP